MERPVRFKSQYHHSQVDVPHSHWSLGNEFPSFVKPQNGQRMIIISFVKKTVPEIEIEPKLEIKIEKN